MASLSMGESLAVSHLTKLLYDFLPASGNPATSFPLAAHQAGIPHAWPQGASKGPGVSHMLTWTLENQRDRFSALMLTIVQQAMRWRQNKTNPLSRAEVEELNRLLLGVRFKIPELLDPAFLDALGPGSSAPAGSPAASPAVPDAVFGELKAKLLTLSSLHPQPRGYAFEAFLAELFAVFDLAPRSAFRLKGEQIDGSFVLHHETFLLEAKWQALKTDAADLRAFAGKVEDKAAWTRGLFISDSGFTDVGLEAFGRGSRVVCMDGLDLYETLDRKRSIAEVLAAKVRRAAETGLPFVPFRDLFNN